MSCALLFMRPTRRSAPTRIMAFGEYLMMLFRRSFSSRICRSCRSSFLFASWISSVCASTWRFIAVRMRRLMKTYAPDTRRATANATPRLRRVRHSLGSSSATSQRFRMASYSCPARMREMPSFRTRSSSRSSARRATA